MAFFNFRAGTLATESVLGAADDLLCLEKAFFLSSVNFWIDSPCALLGIVNGTGVFGRAVNGALYSTFAFLLANSCKVFVRKTNSSSESPKVFVEVWGCLFMLAALSTDVVTGPFILNSFCLRDSSTSILFSGIESSSLLLTASHLDELLTSFLYVRGW